MTEIPAPERHTFEHAAARKGLSIQLRLLFLVMAAALPPLLFSFYQARSASSVERSNAKQRALMLARRIATRVDDHVNSVDAVLLVLSRSVGMDPASMTRNDAMLGTVRRDLGSRPLNLSVADASGHLLGLSGRPASRYAQVSVADRRYFQEAMRTRGLGIGEPMIGRLSHEFTLTLARAVRGRDGEATGVVAASTPLRALRAMLIPADLPAGTVVTLMDSAGTVLARSEGQERWLGRRAPEYEISSRALKQREGVTESAGADSVVRLKGFASATRAPWTVEVAIPSDVALERVDAQEMQTLLLFVGSLTLSLLLAWFLARGIADPVRTLSDDADAFAAGDLTHRSGVTANGEVGMLAATFNRMADALERRGAELQTSERRYRSLFNTLPLPMWVYDVQTLRFLEVNEAAVARYGYTRDEFRAMTVLDIRSPEEAAAFLDRGVPAEVIRTSGVPYHHRTRSGETLEVEINSDDLQYGASRARLVVAIDVTERRRTERALRESQEQLRQSQKMEAIGSLAGGIAHDFNNLLTAILGYCDLALDELATGNSANDDVAEIRRAALRAADLTHQLLAFSRRQMLKPLVFSLGAAAQQAERILSRLIGENIALTLDVDPETPDVCADPTQLEQVILNLAVNARDAMPRGGQLLMRTGVRRLDASRAMSGTTLAAGTYATLEVSDTGTGIAPGVRDRLFEPFFTTKARGQGTGLGLATVYGIVKQSGGAIEVESEEGAGARFTLYFPAAPAAADDGPAEVAPVSTQSARLEAHCVRPGAMILLAEDDDAVRAIARETLERAGYHVMAAANGREALTLAAQHDAPIDLLLTDVIMPGMNGRELADALLVLRPAMRVLFASGYTDNVLLDQGAMLPGVTLLDKPFTPAALAAKVAEVLSADAAAPVAAPALTMLGAPPTHVVRG